MRLSYVALLTAVAAGLITPELSRAQSPGFGPITAPPLPLPYGSLNVPYPPSTFQVAGGTPPLTWSVTSGSLPAGMSLNPLAGVLSGTPTSTGEYNFVVGVVDSQGRTAATPVLSLIVLTKPGPILV